MKQKIAQILICIGVMVTLLASALPSPVAAADTIVLVSSQDTKESLYGRWLSLIYTEVFRRIGYEFEYMGLPGGRAPIVAEEGEVDGEIHRGIDYEKTAKNLLRVSVPSFSVSYMAYAVQPGIVLNGWESLKNTSYTVEYRRGAKIPEAALRPIVSKERLSSTTTAEQGLKKLIERRTDIYIEQDFVAIETLSKIKQVAFNTESVYAAGIMDTANSYVYLHKKHADLLPKIAAILKRMQQEGTIEHLKAIAREKP